MSLTETIQRLPGALAIEMKGVLQKVEYLAAPAMERHLKDQGPPKGQRVTGNQIGAQSGRLSRSLIPGQEDHISAITIGGGTFKIEFGTSVPYAKIHEYGGTIQHPGGTDFMIIRGTFIPLRSGHPHSFGKTKPHAIEIPERPFMRPGLAYLEREVLPKLLQGAMDAAWKRAS